MPPTATHAKPPVDEPPAPDEAKADSGKVKADDPSGLYVVVYTLPGGGGAQVELHSEETAAARVSLLTYASKQHRKELADADEPSELPEGGGVFELNRRDIKVYKLGTTEVTDF